MSTAAKRHPPRQSALSGRHPAVPAAPAGSATTPGPPETRAKPETPAQPTTDSKPATAPNPATPETDPFPGQGSQKLTVNVPRDLVGQAKDAYWLARGEYRTFSAWVEAALVEQIERTKATHGVENIPPRPGGSLPTGRPLS